MRITGVRTVLLTAPWTGDPNWTGGEAVEGGGPAPWERSAALIEIEADDGHTGLGETIAGYFIPEAVAPLVDYFAGLLIDLRLDPREPARVADELRQRCRWWGRTGLAQTVLSGVEMALWDLAGKAAGVPVHALLGGAVHARLPVYASGGTGSWPLERTVAQAQAYVDAGFRALKLGTGFEGRPGGFATGRTEPPYGTWYAGTKAGRVGDERMKVEALRESLGPGIDLAFDSHAVQVREPWSRATARSLLRALEPYDILFLEEPLRYDDVEGYAELRRATSVPIAGGECLSSVEEFAVFLDHDALDLVQPDAGQVGGIDACRQVAEAAARSHVGLAVHTGGSIGPALAANLHVAFASSNAAWVELALAPSNLRDALLVEPLRLDAGLLTVPTAPGLGVHLPPAFLIEHPFRPGAIEYA